tara:strand:- start:121 stop:567 length:447 start_codon:yes stop_codon:yes gene_type:complete
MKNFDLRKYLAEGRLLKENFGVNLDTPENAASFKDYLAQNGISAEVDDVWVKLKGGVDVIRKVDILRDKFLGTSQDSSPFRDKRPSDIITLAVDKAYYDDDKGEFTLTPTDVVVTADNFEDIIFDEVGDEKVNFTSYVRTYPKIFKRV